MVVRNYLTLVRVLLTLVLTYLLAIHTATGLRISMALIVLIILIDIIDEKVMEHLQPRTKVFSFLHPFADKMIAMWLLFLFSLQGIFSFWVLGFFIIRDMVVGIVRWLASQEDVLIKEETYRKMMIYVQYGIIITLLTQELLLYQESGSLLQIDSVLVILFTVLAIILAFGSILHHGVVYARSLRQRRKLGKTIQHEKIILLANKQSSGYKDAYRMHLLRLFSKRRKAAIMYLPLKKNMYENIEQKIKDDQQIIIAGGDGSFESALNYKPFWKKRLGFFPLGAGNAFYSYFYKGKRFEYLRSWFQFREIKLDILELEWNSGKIQTTFLSLGLDAEVMRQSKERTRIGFANYFVAGAKVIFGSRASYSWQCLIDGKKYEWKNCVNLTLGKVPYYGYTLRSLIGKIKPDDGKVHGLALVNTHSSLLNKTIRVWGLLLAALAIDKSPLLVLQGKEFKIQSETPFPLQAGGDFLGYTRQIRVRVVRQQKVLMI